MKQMTKKPNPVFMYQMDREFQVVTQEGIMAGHPTDWLAFDPLSGHTWVVADDYVQLHYEETA